MATELGTQQYNYTEATFHTLIQLGEFDSSRNSSKVQDTFNLES